MYSDNLSLQTVTVVNQQYFVGINEQTDRKL